jgi:hypothetical protein
VGSLLSIGDHRSGGVPVNSSGGTIYGGPSSVASRSVASPSVTNPSVSEFSYAPRPKDDDASSVSSFNTGFSKPTFNPNKYGNPGLRRPIESVFSSDSTNGKSAWAKTRMPPSKVNSDAARQLEQEVARKRLAAEKCADNYDVEVAERPDDSDDEEPVPVPVPSLKAPVRRAQANGTFSKSHIQAVISDKNQGARGDELVPKNPKRQTTTDISRVVYSQE